VQSGTFREISRIRRGLVLKKRQKLEKKELKFHLRKKQQPEAEHTEVYS